ncbi:NADH-quinone oxidoreductase subunit NuoE [Nostocoides sp. F2B08]|nr:NADH-quinone oxidoreductase subunit NuoE [Tetrasphaera sp. F2B08]KAB7746429.1 NADH-quinone oxidoreductase subunit NuoE [Tetrasphaera sp. F2B08]
MAGDFGLQTASGHLEVPAESKEPYAPEVEATFRADAAEIIARYPQKRSALLPMLHLVQSIDGYITGRGIDLCAELLELSAAEVSGVATFYTQYKRHPNGEYTVGVCTNTLCAIMGGDEIWEAVSEHLGIGHDETTEDGRITLERVECNAACDYAPVVMTNWEFFDNQTPESTIALVDELRAGNPVRPTRGPSQVRTFKEVSRVLAGFSDGLADEGVGAGPPSLVGLSLAKENGWEAPRAEALPPTSSREADTPAAADAARSDGTSEQVKATVTPDADTSSDGDAPGRTEITPESPEAAAGTQAAPEATDPSDEVSGPAAKDEDEVTAPDSEANRSRDEVYDVGLTESGNRASDNRASDNRATDTEDET